MTVKTAPRIVPTKISETSLAAYLTAIKRFPMLGSEEEYMLAKRYAEHGDPEAAHKLVTSHLRLVAKIAMSYRTNNIPTLDLISEGTVGLMRAVKKFDPEKGFRLSTYAIWWIKAAINEFLVNSWSLVKLGSAATHRRLFFNLRKLKARLGIYDASDFTLEKAQVIAHELSVPVEEVIEMNGRLSYSDASLNQPVAENIEAERQDLIADGGPDQEAILGELEESNERSKLLRGALGCLNPRERRIIEGRRLAENPRTLDEIGAEYGISRERVRQIENAAFDKLRKAVLSAPNARQLSPVPMESIAAGA